MKMSKCSVCGSPPWGPCGAMMKEVCPRDGAETALSSLVKGMVASFMLGLVAGIIIDKVFGL